MASMASNAAKAVGKAASGVSKKAQQSGSQQSGSVAMRGAKRDPELYVCSMNIVPSSYAKSYFQILFGVMSAAFGLAGYYFGRKPTSATSEAEVSVANSSMPWQVDHDHDDHTKHFKYQYHPKGDTNQTPKNAPSALNTVIVPNVTLPRVCI